MNRCLSILKLKVENRLKLSPLHFNLHLVPSFYPQEASAINRADICAYDVRHIEWFLQ